MKPIKIETFYDICVSGVYDKDTRRVGNPTQHRIRRISKHPHFWGRNPDLKQNGDIVLLELANPVEFSNGISSIDLTNNTPESLINTHCITAGWGSKWVEHTSGSNVLQVADLVINEKDHCQAPGAGSYHFCAGKAGSSSCSGDFGNPHACQMEGGWVLVGVVSYYPDDCNYLKPSTFTSVHFYKHWIEEETGISK